MANTKGTSPVPMKLEDLVEGWWYRTSFTRPQLREIFRRGVAAEWAEQAMDDAEDTLYGFFLEGVPAMDETTAQEWLDEFDWSEPSARFWVEDATAKWIKQAEENGDSLLAFGPAFIPDDPSPHVWMDRGEGDRVDALRYVWSGVDQANGQDQQHTTNLVLLTFPDGTPNAVKDKVFSLIETCMPWSAEWRSDKGALIIDASEDPGEVEEMRDTFEEILLFINNAKGALHE